MKTLICESTFFALVISLLGYELGMFLRKKTRLAVFNPLLVAIATVMVVLLVFDIDYGTYEAGAGMLGNLLTPSTVALAVPLYRQLNVLKENGVSIVLGILAGVLTSLVTVLLMAIAFGMTHTEYVTLLPKSITTAIGMGMSEELGGMVTITVAVIIVTGIVGNMMGGFVCRVFRIEERVAVGLAFGTAAHAIGTARAMELGEVEGAMSSLSIVVSGLLTVVGANIFAGFY